MTSLFTVVSYELAQQVLTDNVRFSSAGYARTMGEGWARDGGLGKRTMGEGWARSYVGADFASEPFGFGSRFRSPYSRAERVT